MYSFYKVQVEIFNIIYNHSRHFILLKNPLRANENSLFSSKSIFRCMLYELF